jgi:hypothetical protein
VRIRFGCALDSRIYGSSILLTTHTYVAVNNINIQSIAMETQQCIIFSTVFKVQNISYCLYLLGYRNSLLQFGSKRLILCYLQQHETHLGLNVQCQIFLSNFHQIWTCLTHFHKSFQYKISRKSIKWEVIWYVRTDSQIWRGQQVLFVTLQKCLKIMNNDEIWCLPV